MGELHSGFPAMLRALSVAALAIVVLAAEPAPKATVDKLSAVATAKVSAAAASGKPADLIDAAKAAKKADDAKGKEPSTSAATKALVAENKGAAPANAKTRCCGKGAVESSFDPAPMKSDVFSVWPKVEKKVNVKCGSEAASVCTNVGASDVKEAGKIEYCDGTDADDAPVLNKIRFKICKGKDGSKINVQCLDFGKTYANSSVTLSLIDDETSKTVGKPTKMCPANGLFEGDASPPTDGAPSDAPFCPTVRLGDKPWVMASASPYPVAADDEGKNMYKLKIRVKGDAPEGDKAESSADKADACVVLTVPAGEDSEGNPKAYYYSAEAPAATKPCKNCGGRRLI